MIRKVKILYIVTLIFLMSCDFEPRIRVDLDGDGKDDLVYDTPGTI